ncbi:MAG: YcxB family protein [Chitinophagaceae bacterium]|nr:YcxB family protein [Chitinophagaceae bacterium]
MNNLVLNTHLSLNDYIKVNLYLLYRKFMVKFTTSMGLLLLLWLLYNCNTYDFFPWLQFLLGSYLIIGFPLTTYFAAKRNYKANSRISERMTYEFNSEQLEMIGESFHVKLTWDKIYSITESNNWILIWQNPHIADVIPKRYFTTGTLQAFRAIIASHPSIKNKSQHLRSRKRIQ